MSMQRCFRFAGDFNKAATSCSLSTEGSFFSFRGRSMNVTRLPLHEGSGELRLQVRTVGAPINGADDVRLAIASEGGLLAEIVHGYIANGAYRAGIDEVAAALGVTVHPGGGFGAVRGRTERVQFEAGIGYHVLGADRV